MLLFVVIFLSIYTGMHALVYWGVSPLLRGHPVLPAVTMAWMGVMILMPIVIRMLDKVGTFANVLAVLKRHGINVEEVTNTIFEGGGAACAKLRVLSRPTEACLAEIRAFDEVLHVDTVTLPILA